MGRIYQELQKLNIFAYAHFAKRKKVMTLFIFVPLSTFKSGWGFARERAGPHTARQLL